MARLGCGWPQALKESKRPAVLRPGLGGYAGNGGGCLSLWKKSDADSTYSRRCRLTALAKAGDLRERAGEVWVPCCQHSPVEIVMRLTEPDPVLPVLSQHSVILLVVDEPHSAIGPLTTTGYNHAGSAYT